MNIESIDSYLGRMQEAASQMQESMVVQMLAESLNDTWSTGKSIYICGNGGSAGNAIHLANDLIYGAGMASGRGLRAEALSANSAVITCLANDTGYENIYSEQLKAKGSEGDVLIALSGSGNSSRVIGSKACSIDC